MWQQLALWDKRGFYWLHQFSRQPLSQWLARNFSRSGDGYGYALFGVIAAFADPELGPTFFLLLLTAYAIELPAYWFLKNRLQRARPCQVLTGCQPLVDPHDKFSFPSGHSAAAFLFATVLGWYIPQLAIVAWSWATLVACSRVVLGVHYPGDIFAGASLGLVAATISLTVVI